MTETRAGPDSAPTGLIVLRHVASLSIVSGRRYAAIHGGVKPAHAAASGPATGRRRRVTHPAGTLCRCDSSRHTRDVGCRCPDRRRSLAVVAAGQALAQRAPRAALHGRDAWPPCSARCCWSSCCSSPAWPALRGLVTVDLDHRPVRGPPGSGRSSPALSSTSRRSSTTGPARPSSRGSSRSEAHRRRLPRHPAARPGRDDRPPRTARSGTNEGFDLSRRWSPPPSRRRRATAAARRRSPSSSSGRGSCPTDVIAPGADVYLRKAKEVIQSARLTPAFPGQAGKQQIITAYLNEIFYGHDAYGIAAAAQRLLRHLGPREAHARPGGAPRGAAPVAVDARPVPLRQDERRGRPGRVRGPRRPSSAATGSSRTCRPAAGRS